MKTWWDKGVPIYNISLFFIRRQYALLEKRVWSEQSRRALHAEARCYVFLTGCPGSAWISSPSWFILTVVHGCPTRGTWELQWKEMWRWEAPLWCGWLSPLYHNKPSLNNGDKAIFRQRDEYFKGGASLNVYQWCNTEQASLRDKSPGRDIINTGKNSSFFCHIRYFQSVGSLWTEAGI